MPSNSCANLLDRTSPGTACDVAVPQRCFTSQLLYWGRWRSQQAIQPYVEDRSPFRPPASVALFGPDGTQHIIPTATLWPAFLFDPSTAAFADLPNAPSDDTPTPAPQCTAPSPRLYPTRPADGGTPSTSRNDGRSSGDDERAPSGRFDVGGQPAPPPCNGGQCFRRSRATRKLSRAQ